MSIDKSLVVRSRLKRHRNVLTRAERIEHLKQEEKWEEERSVFSLPKVRNIKQKPRKAAKAAEAAVAAEAAPGATEEKPAAESQTKKE